jgi:multidrug efflux pump
MRQAMGVAVFAGMIGVTLFGLFLTPLFYVIVRRLTGNAPLRHHGGKVAAPAAPIPSAEPVAPVVDALPQRGK